MKPRHLTSEILEALADTPVVLVNGARQTGKSTLVRTIAEGPHRARYLTFDDATVLAVAERDPDGFLAALDGPVVLDEVQRVRGLFRGLKMDVDRERTPGRYLLTGSADVLLLPGLSESLAGRMEILTLWPFSQGEIEGHREQFIDELFERPPAVGRAVMEASGLWDRVVHGGYPEVLTRSTAKRRRAWFNAYITTILQRDVRDLANIEGLTQMPRLLSLLAARVGGLVNYSEVSRSSGLPLSTLKRYMTLLETTFLVQLLPAWSVNLSKRLVKSSKLYLSDTGLVSHLVGLTSVDPIHDGGRMGRVLENFVVMELKKQLGWSERQPAMYHFRLQTGQEVDVVLEDAAGRVIGIEVKARTQVGKHDIRGLKALAEAAGERFVRGVVLYGGREVVGLGGQMYAVPLPMLWRV